MNTNNGTRITVALLLLAALGMASPLASASIVESNALAYATTVASKGPLELLDQDPVDIVGYYDDQVFFGKHFTVGWHVQINSNAVVPVDLEIAPAQALTTVEVDTPCKITSVEWRADGLGGATASHDSHYRLYPHLYAESELGGADTPEDVYIVVEGTAPGVGGVHFSDEWIDCEITLPYEQTTSVGGDIISSITDVLGTLVTAMPLPPVDIPLGVFDANREGVTGTSAYPLNDDPSSALPVAGPGATLAFYTHAEITFADPGDEMWDQDYIKYQFSGKGNKLSSKVTAATQVYTSNQYTMSDGQTSQYCVTVNAYDEETVWFDHEEQFDSASACVYISYTQIAVEELIIDDLPEACQSVLDEILGANPPSVEDYAACAGASPGIMASPGWLAFPATVNGILLTYVMPVPM